MSRPDPALRVLSRIVVIGLALAAAGCSRAASRGVPPSTTATTIPARPLLPLHATRGDQPAVLDSAGRQLILRGVNLNSLGDYFQADPALPPVVPVTEDDWSTMASHGVDVVRLLVSWSSLEPAPNKFDDAYLGRVHAAVAAAAAHDIYSVIDMHQDAWGKYIASPPGTVCPAGRSVAIGWDGAPAWATLTDGASTCRQGGRENAEAVLNAWDSFYANRGGIMDQLVSVWAHLGQEFAADPAVAGYDLLNEPNHGHDTATAKAGLGRFFGRAITAIRGAENAAGALHHIAFFETTVFGVPVDPGFTADTNLVFAPHNYGDSITNLPIEGLFDYFSALARSYQTAMWTGEYGWFGDPAGNAPKLARFAARSDQLLTAGDAWWQWRQACGDPHTIGQPGGIPPAELIHFQHNTCPGDHNGGVIPEWQCVWRPYPRAAPGRLAQLTSDCGGRRLTMSGATSAAGAVDVWFPDHHLGTPVVSGQNLTGLQTATVPGGWRISAQVHDGYSLTAAVAGS